MSILRRNRLSVNSLTGCRLPKPSRLFGLGRLEADLEAILGTRVDLIPAADLKPGVRERVESDLIAL